MFKNMLPRKTFGPKKKKVTEGWTKLHKEEIHDFVFLTQILFW